jgi:uncharacterized membrane protein
VVGAHVLFGVACVISGLVAMLANKGRGRHSTFGTIYFWCMGGVFLTMTFLAFVRWAEDYVLFLLGALAFGFAILGRHAARHGRRLRMHAICMGSSYIVLLTAFYVDNGKSLPIWRDLPLIAYWTIPALIGAPLIYWAVLRHPLLRSPRV